MIKQTSSPLPQVKKKMTFCQALSQILLGERITKESWGDTSVYFFIQDTFLKIHRDGKDHDLIVCEADINGTDYIVV